MFALEDLEERGVPAYTQLLGQAVLCERFSESKVSVRFGDQKHLPNGQVEELQSQVQYGFVWACLGSKPQPLFDIPEYHEVDRRNVCTGVFGVEVSAPRVIENFLDMGHFPFVHTGLLGIEPHTEVVDYQVTVSNGSKEILATECLFFQPQAAAGSGGGVGAHLGLLGLQPLDLDALLRDRHRHLLLLLVDVRELLLGGVQPQSFELLGGDRAGDPRGAHGDS